MEAQLHYIITISENSISNQRKEVILLNYAWRKFIILS